MRFTSLDSNNWFEFSLCNVKFRILLHCNSSTKIKKSRLGSNTDSDAKNKNPL